MTFASTSLPRHLVRGVIGFGSLIAAFALLPAIGPVSLLLLPVTLLAFKLQRDCVDGQCKLTTAA